MRVFLAGATGVVGRHLAPRLIAAGHSVVGMTRSADKAEAVRALGVEPVICDALNRTAVVDAVRQAKPDVVVHQLTAIPSALDPRTLDRAFVLTNRLRTEGIDIFLEAARQAGARRFIAQSFGGYRLQDPIPKGIQSIVAAIQYLERVVPAAGGPMTGLVLRYGGFYGPGSGIARDGATVEAIRKRAFPIVGGGTGQWSWVHMDDVASATMLALDRGEPGIYNIADDDPARVSEWLPVLAEAVAAPPPRRVPAWLGRLLAGENVVALMTRAHGIDNREAKRALDWQPRWPTWREGFRSAL